MGVLAANRGDVATREATPRTGFAARAPRPAREGVCASQNPLDEIASAPALDDLILVSKILRFSRA